MNIQRILAVFALAFVFAGCTGKPHLVIYAPGKMFPRQILKEFKKETGVKVRYVTFDTNETMYANLTGGKGKYDLVITDGYMADTVIYEGFAEKIDSMRLSNYRNINTMYRQPYYDPDDEYTIPYGAGIQTIVYDPEKITVPIKGYSDLWNPELGRNLGVIDNYRVINAIALKAAGSSYNTTNLFSIEMVSPILFQLLPNIRLIQSDKLENKLLSGEISVALMYTEQVTSAKKAKPELEVVFPAEGIGLIITPAFIPVNAPNADAAYAFLDFILDPERGARCFEHLGRYSTFSASDPYISPAYRELITLPESLHKGSVEMLHIGTGTEALHELLWTRFKESVSFAVQDKVD
jgi:spermidine/putrescine-binding protein